MYSNGKYNLNPSPKELKDTATDWPSSLSIVETVASYFFIKTNFIGIKGGDIPRPVDQMEAAVWNYAVQPLYNMSLALVKFSLLLGISVTVTSTVRLIILVEGLFGLVADPDPTFNIGFTTSALETNLAIITASAPALIPLLGKRVTGILGEGTPEAPKTENEEKGAIKKELIRTATGFTAKTLRSSSPIGSEERVINTSDVRRVYDNSISPGWPGTLLAPSSGFTSGPKGSAPTPRLYTPRTIGLPTPRRDGLNPPPPPPIPTGVAMPLSSMSTAMSLGLSSSNLSAGVLGLSLGRDTLGGNGTSLTGLSTASLSIGGGSGEQDRDTTRDSEMSLSYADIVRSYTGTAPASRVRRSTST
ncbi:hypothetical protein MKZ38_004438 [Zalerion maritima]|uniref:Uncharacterized protein n=1 Tax=Zalerion maritima TaxID=339359 RepID=A0AAD5WWF4_9PEZI|nr:hypothetical protein MKZ38_004438 [Zalerion maritima]